MFILFGTTEKTKVMTEIETNELCMNCNNMVKHGIIRKRSYFTLFFIPLIPLHTRYSIICPACTFERKIKKAEAKAFCNRIVTMVDNEFGYSDNKKGA